MISPYYQIKILESITLGENKRLLLNRSIYFRKTWNIRIFRITWNFIIVCKSLVIHKKTLNDGISFWTPLKPQHNNPKPNPFGQSTLVYWFLYSSHHPSKTPCLPWISYATQKLMLYSWKMVESSLKHSIRFCGFFPSLKHNLLHIVLLKCPHVQTAILKFTSCDNQALVGCIPIATVPVSLNLKS